MPFQPSKQAQLPPGPGTHVPRRQDEQATHDGPNPSAQVSQVGPVQALLHVQDPSKPLVQLPLGAHSVQLVQLGPKWPGAQSAHVGPAKPGEQTHDPFAPSTQVPCGAHSAQSVQFGPKYPSAQLVQSLPFRPTLQTVVPHPAGLYQAKLNVQVGDSPVETIRSA